MRSQLGRRTTIVTVTCGSSVQFGEPAGWGNALLCGGMGIGAMPDVTALHHETQHLLHNLIQGGHLQYHFLHPRLSQGTVWMRLQN